MATADCGHSDYRYNVPDCMFMATHVTLRSILPSREASVEQVGLADNNSKFPKHACELYQPNRKLFKKVFYPGVRSVMSYE